MNKSGESSGCREGDEFCCGMHEVCEQGRILKSTNPSVEYYDDEELDIYQGRPANSYTDDETAEFRDVMDTMFEHDVPGWLKSLEQRGIELPNSLRL